MASLDVLVLYNRPELSADDSDAASEAGVLESVEAVASALEARGHRVRQLSVGSEVPEFLAALQSIRPPDVAVNLFEGLGGVGHGEAEITGLLELLGWPLTGSPAECLALVRHKPRTKWLLAGAGLPTPNFQLVSSPEEIDSEALACLLDGGPAIVKPAHEDASLGIGSDSVVTELVELTALIDRVGRRYGPVLVERFIVGREFNAAAIALPDLQLLPLAEIEFSGLGRPGWQIVTYDAKWAIGSAADLSTPAQCPAQVTPEVAERISKAALAAFQITGCRDYARVDLRMDMQGEVFILEVNGNPDIGPTAGFARALRAGGISYEEFVDRLVRTARSRRR